MKQAQNVRQFWFVVALIVVALAACQPAGDESQELPTLAVLPSATPTERVDSSIEQAAVLAVDTAAPLPSATGSSDEQTAVPTLRPTITLTPRPTQPPVTIEIRDEVRFSTLTPGPQGGNENLVMADLVITEGDFQRAVDNAVAVIDSIQSANIDFVPGGIDVELTALGGQAFITGHARLVIQVSGGFATMTIEDVTVNAATPPLAYLEVVSGEFFTAIIHVLDSLLTERAGEGHDLENIILNDQAMQVFLLVPQS